MTVFKGVLSVGTGLVLMGVALVASSEPRPAGDLSRAAEEMAAAASQFLSALDPAQRNRASFHIKDAERFNFHFFPIPRRGIALKDLNEAQRQLAYALMSSGLSAQGYQKGLTIMSLGQVLRDLNPPPHNPHRDSDQYHVTIFGAPDPKGTWGWRIEGFHLSLNFTIVEGKGISATPSFFGSLPATVKEGARKGLRALAREEDLARQLVKSLDADQRKAAAAELPKFEDTVGGLLTGNLRRIERGAPRGVPYARLTPAQQALLLDLIREFALHHRQELAAQDLEKIEKAGRETIHFRWAGSTEPFEPHHYMIQGQSFLVEYDNTQDAANHVHAVWRDFDSDFGDDLLRRHYDLDHRR